MMGYDEFAGAWGERAQLAWDTLSLKSARGIPSWMVHTMDMPFMEQCTGRAPGDYVRDPEGVYVAFQRHAGACFIDQFIPENPLTMGQNGFGAHAPRGATTGAEEVVVDGIRIDSPEAVVEHMERFAFPRRAREIESFDPGDPARIERMVAGECAVQRKFGGEILKGPHSGEFQAFPNLRYWVYGYVPYFTAYGLYPEVMERDFRQQADLAVVQNRAAARAIVEGGLPRMLRLDHDMADSRGTLVDVRTLDALWFPHFARAIAPLLDAGIRLIWHCDGNLMEMVPRLIEAGVGGFQGFQYEDGMDYARICRMTDRAGGPLVIMAGASVTRTLPFGRRQDVVDELNRLVDYGPPIGLFLGASSSIAPGTSRENIRVLVEGLHHFRRHGRTQRFGPG